MVLGGIRTNVTFRVIKFTSRVSLEYASLKITTPITVAAQSQV
jgi:hypothetical protein